MSVIDPINQLLKFGYDINLSVDQSTSGIICHIADDDSTYTVIAACPQDALQNAMQWASAQVQNMNSGLAEIIIGYIHGGALTTTQLISLAAYTNPSIAAAATVALTDLMGKPYDPQHAAAPRRDVRGGS